MALRELLEDEGYNSSQAKLALVLGKDIGGQPIVVDLARMPHLLIAGTTGSGKSVAINTMIMSLLYRLTPDQCKFIMIDPKMLELSVYDDIPHLLAPVVTEPKKAIVALKWVVREMENRYRAMSKLGVRNIEGYNQRLEQARNAGEQLTRRVQTGFDPDTGKPIYEEEPFDLNPLPFIVVVVDEMADLMLVAGKDIEAAIQRLAQMARAAGIHIIMATQRPSVDVITGTIKANFPTRVSFHVTTKIDSRTILGETGAEQLLGQGDMLYMANGGRITRIHGPFISDREVESIVKCLKSQGEPAYLQEVTESDEDGLAGEDAGGFGGGNGGIGRRSLRPGGRAGRARAQMLHQLHPALSADRLQPRRPHRRAHGKGRRGEPGQPRRQARSAGAGRARAGLAGSGAGMPEGAPMTSYERGRRVPCARAGESDRPRMAEILTIAGLLLGGLIASEIGYRLGLVFGPKYEAFGRAVRHHPWRHLRPGRLPDRVLLLGRRNALRGSAATSSSKRRMRWAQPGCAPMCCRSRSAASSRPRSRNTRPTASCC